MSINQTRKLMEKKGCGIFMGVVGLLLGLGFVTSGNCNGMFNGQPGQDEANQAQAIPLVKVKDVSFSFAEFDQAVSNFRNQQEMQTQQMLKPEDIYEGMPVRTRAAVYLQVASSVADQAVLRYMVQDRKLDVSETGIRKTMAGLIEASHEKVIADLRAQGKIKPGASQADIDKALEVSGAQPLKVQLENQSRELDDAFRDPSRRQSIVDFATGMTLLFNMRKDIQVTEEDLKKSFEKINVKTIQVSVKDGEKDTVDQKADKILKEIKAGLSFESAIAKYSSATAPQGTKLSDQVLPLTMDFLEQSQDLAPLKTLKAGELSPPIKSGANITLFKVISRDPNLPKDFAITKDSMRLQRIDNLANAKLKEAMDTTKKLVEPKWASPSLEMLSKLSSSLPKTPTPTPQEVKDLTILWDEALKLAQKTAGDHAAIYAAYLIGDSLWKGQTPDARKPLTDRYVETLKLLFTIEESAPERLELAGLLIDKKDPLALEQLKMAATANGSFGPIGQANNQLIFKLIDKAKAAGLITDDQLPELNEIQSKWLKDKKTFDENRAAEIAQRKKDEEAARKAAAEEQKRLKEEEEKAKKEAAKTGTKPPSEPTPEKGASSSDLTNPNPAPATKP